MTMLLRIAERILIALIPACVLYFANFGDAATRLDTLLDNTVSPVAAAVPPFAFAIALFLGILSFCHVAARIIFEWLPLSLKMSFGFYRNAWMREELYPNVALAVELNRQWKMQASETAGSNGRFDEFSAQVNLVRAKLSQVGIRLPTRTSPSGRRFCELSCHWPETDSMATSEIYAFSIRTVCEPRVGVGRIIVNPASAPLIL